MLYLIAHHFRHGGMEKEVLTAPLRRMLKASQLKITEKWVESKHPILSHPWVAVTSVAGVVGRVPLLGMVLLDVMVALIGMAMAAYAENTARAVMAEKKCMFL